MSRKPFDNTPEGTKGMQYTRKDMAKIDQFLLEYGTNYTELQFLHLKGELSLNKSKQSLKNSIYNRARLIKAEILAAAVKRGDEVGDQTITAPKPSDAVPSIKEKVTRIINNTAKGRGGNVLELEIKDYKIDLKGGKIIIRF